MMRMRTLKPSFWDDEVVASWPSDVRLAYQWVWGACDDWGCCRTTAALIRAGAFAYHDMPMDAAKAMLATMVESGHLVPYEADGQALFFVPSWFRHQQPADPALPQWTPPELSDATRAFLDAYAATLLRASRVGAKRGRHNAAKMQALYQALPAECRARAENVPWHTAGTPVAAAPLGDGETGRRGDGETGNAHNARAPMGQKESGRQESCSPEVEAQLLDVYNHWLASSGLPVRTDLPGGNYRGLTFRDMALARLGEGLTADDLKRAITACHASKRHRRNGVTSWGHVLRDMTTVQEFLALDNVTMHGPGGARPPVKVCEFCGTLGLVSIEKDGEPKSLLAWCSCERGAAENYPSSLAKIGLDDALAQGWRIVVEP